MIQNKNETNWIVDGNIRGVEGKILPFTLSYSIYNVAYKVKQIYLHNSEL